MTYPLTFYNGSALRILLITCAGLLSGCAYNWQQAEEVSAATVRKSETALASDFCSKLLDGMMLGCAVRMTNTATGDSNCVIVVHPGDMVAVRHEAGGHCMGQDH